MDRRVCRECGGVIEMIGVGFYGITVEVKCLHCGEQYEVLPEELGDDGIAYYDRMVA
ncbi:MAG: hypothetical protein AABZ39_04875 [Spirochaetota bacterium]